MKIAKLIFSLILSAILFNSSMAMGPNSNDEESYTQDIEFGNNVRSKNDDARDHFEYFLKLPIELQLMILYFDLESIPTGRDIRTRASILSLVSKLIKDGLSQFKHKEIWIKLLAAEAYVKENSATIVQDLIDAAKNNNIVSVRFLILGNADLKKTADSYNGYECTALISLVDNSHIEAIKMLIATGADLNSRDIFGNTALILAVKIIKQTDIVKRIEIIKMLIAANADLNIKDNNDITALSWATRFGQTKIVKILIAANANLYIEDSNGNRASIVAWFMDRTKIEKLLKSAESRSKIE